MSNSADHEDHDQRLKLMIQHFVKDFFELFFPYWAERVDMSCPEWISTEVFHDPPTGKRRYLDLLGKMPITSSELCEFDSKSEALALVHIEIESSTSTVPAIRQLYDHLHFLTMKHGLPVIPVAIFLNVGKNGVSIEEHSMTFGNLRKRFEYLSVGLPKLDAEYYLNQTHMIGVGLTPFMNIPDNQIAYFGAEALLRIFNANLTEQERYLLGECVNAYLPMTEQDLKLFEEMIAQPRYEGVRAMNKTPYDLGKQEGRVEGRVEGRQEGRQEGRVEGLMDALIRLMTKKFGSLDQSVLVQIQQKSTDELILLLEQSVTANSLQEMGF